MGYINGLLQSRELTGAQTTQMLSSVSGKNVSELNMLCAQYDLDETFRNTITAVTSLYGSFGEVIPELRRLSVNEETAAALKEIEAVHKVLLGFCEDKDINLDFSIVNDLSYYSGIIFQGYIEGVPLKVLSGGRYDKLLRKFGKRSDAIGFAVYLDLLERLSPPRCGAEVDALILYSNETDPEELAGTVRALTASGQSVRVQRDDPGDVKFNRTIKM